MSGYRVYEAPPTRIKNKCEKSLKKERALNFKQKDSSCLHLTLTVCGPLGERTHHRSISHYTHCAPPAHHIHAISSPSCIYNFLKQYLDANYLDNKKLHSFLDQLTRERPISCLSYPVLVPFNNLIYIMMHDICTYITL